jgi:uncharacterized membrane protein
MTIEQFIQNLIYTHAGFGGIALLTGLLALIVKKGSSAHKKTGKLFFYAMLTSAIMALVISVLPNHESPFLFGVGIFSSYFILSGYRALRFKHKNPNLTIDRVISGIMLVSGIAMALYFPIFHQEFNIVLAVFGCLGIYGSIRDLRLFGNPEKLQQNWLKLHLGQMTGGYIAATTAFVVVNNFFPSFYGWFIPGIIGSFYIAYWVRKLEKKNTSK